MWITQHAKVLEISPGRCLVKNFKLIKCRCWRIRMISFMTWDFSKTHFWQLEQSIEPQDSNRIVWTWLYSIGSMEMHMRQTIQCTSEKHVRDQTFNPRQKTILGQAPFCLCRTPDTPGSKKTDFLFMKSFSTAER